jgi:hypothetical protein
MLVTCRECEAQISDTAKACPKCGAPASVAFAKPKPVVDPAPPRLPKVKEVQTKPGFAQGRFGKTMAIILFAYSVLGTIGIVMSWFSEESSGESLAYHVGQGIGLVSIVFGAWRASIPREKRAWVDWVAAAFLLFVAAVTLPVLVNLLGSVSVDSLDVPMGVALGLTGLQTVATVIVAIRLMRQPWYPPKQQLQAVFD